MGSWCRLDDVVSVLDYVVSVLDDVVGVVVVYDVHTEVVIDVTLTFAVAMNDKNVSQDYSSQHRKIPSLENLSKHFPSSKVPRVLGTIAIGIWGST